MNWKVIARIRKILAREQGTIFKDWGGRISIALVYPNSYWVGMSNLGFQTLYRLFNQHDRIVCERVFLEDEILSLESQRPLGDFDVVAFSLPYELDYLNLVKILRQSQIPLFAADRDERHPLLLAGGAAVTANPEPLAPLLDVFVIGEGEAVLSDLVQVLTTCLEPRHELLRELSRLPGVYVPELRPERVKRVWAEEVDDFPTTSTVFTPDTEFGSLYLMEIARGCKWGCRFCLAGFLFRPMRPRSASRLLDQAREGVSRGLRIGLVGATISDHPEIEELVLGLREMGAEFSVSSLRLKPLPHVLLRALAEGKAQSISLAPEAASETLRQVINKNLSSDDIVRVVAEAADAGIRQLKLYFMIGLPTETDEEAAEITRLALDLKRVLEQRRANTRLILNLTPFVPKASTPFQWLPMERAETLKRRLDSIRQSARKKGIEVKSESIEESLIQGLLSRGDRGLAQVLAQVSQPSLSTWRRALEGAGIDPDFIHRESDLDKEFPWSIIDSGVRREYLHRELERALSGLETPPCPTGNCSECGICRGEDSRERSTTAERAP